MSEAATTPSRQQETRQGLVLTLVLLPFTVFGILCGALFLSILAEWAGMVLFWKDQGWHHAERMLEAELDQLSVQFTHGVLVSAPGNRARALVEVAREWVLVKSGFLDWTREAAARAADTTGRARTFRDYLALAHVACQDALMAVAFTVLVFFTRLLVLVLTLPLFGLAAFVGFVDGLVRRDIRRFCADSESGYVYHRARASLVPLAVLPWGLYLALPVTVHPLLILLPAAILLGVVVNITTNNFKKYL
ncbi:MAG: TIGR03747 family integrating conjugative element membrane protein [Azoarcus sp.]|jgi:integrating conjugative element membrane protein (TIGR03747 family)|nr:TIGR03747 family integrating conjugative element membrane protein [Azoarcus sp.]